MGSSINGIFKKKPSTKKNMEEPAAPKMQTRKLNSIFNGQIYQSDVQSLNNRQKIKNSEFGKTQGFYIPQDVPKTQKIFELPLRISSDS